MNTQLSSKKIDKFQKNGGHPVPHPFITHKYLAVSNMAFHTEDEVSSMQWPQNFSNFSPCRPDPMHSVMCLQFPLFYTEDEV